MTQELSVDTTKQLEQEIQRRQQETIKKIEELRDMYGENFEELHLTAEEIEAFKNM